MSINEKLTALATSIRTKSGVSGNLSLDAMKTAVDSITTGGGGSDDEEWYQEPPNDGKQRFYINVYDESLKMLTLADYSIRVSKGSYTINWGDGTDEDTVSNSYSQKGFSHTYASCGKYIITITFSSDCQLYTNGSVFLSPLRPVLEKMYVLN